MFKTLIPAALLAASLSTPAGAAAPVLKVTYADLDLSSTAGVRTLDLRLNAAISRACGDDFAVRGVAEASAIRSCKANLRQAVNVRRAAAITAAVNPSHALAAR